MRWPWPLLVVVLLAGRAAGMGLTQDSVVLDPEMALSLLNANGAGKDASSTLVEYGLSEGDDPLLDVPSASDPQYRERQRAHGGRPAGPGGEEKPTAQGLLAPQLPTTAVPTMAQLTVPMTQMKRRQFGSERAATLSLKLFQNLIHAPFELLRGAMGVRSPATTGAAAG